MGQDNTDGIQYTIFCDIDGVLANFKQAIEKACRDIHHPEFVYEEDKYHTDPKYRNLMWKCISEYQKKYGYVLWLHLDLMPDAHELWNYIKPYNPQILTAAGQPRNHAMEQKRIWVTQHFGSNVKVNIVETAAEKRKFAGPNRILIDDSKKAIDPWDAAGGIGILHTNAANTIRHLKTYGL